MVTEGDRKEYRNPKFHRAAKKFRESSWIGGVVLAVYDTPFCHRPVSPYIRMGNYKVPFCHHGDSSVTTSPPPPRVQEKDHSSRFCDANSTVAERWQKKSIIVAEEWQKTKITIF